MTKHPVYYVIAKAPNGDEWVMPETFTQEDKAQVYLLRKTSDDPTLEYRVERTNTEQQSKLVLNSLYGVYGPVRIQSTPNSMPVQPQRADFTDLELFPQLRDDDESVAYTLTCKECCCEVKNTVVTLKGHTTWHNKLLP